MSYLLDTNILVRLAQPRHDDQRSVAHALRTLHGRPESLSIVPQSLLEFWAVATRPPANNGLGLTVDVTSKLLGKLKRLFTLLPDSTDIFTEWEAIAVKYQVSGKQVYDARLVAAMRIYDVTHLLTFNTDDFKRYNGITVVNPYSIITM
ncbi:MAG: PIN domain-containing protein [Pyrinomonadaceae bacterium]